SSEITGSRTEDAEAEEEVNEEEADSGEEQAEMAPLVPLDTAPESEEDGEEEPASDEEDHEEVFVNHGGAPLDNDRGDRTEHDHDDETAPTKPDAAQETLADYQGDPEIAAAEAVEENEGEIQPVS